MNSKTFKIKGFRPKKRLGQNFLISGKLAGEIADSASISESDTVLEVGPGTGKLTSELAKRAKMVVAVEKDPRMIEILEESFKGNEKVQIVEGDILKTDVPNLNIKKYKLVGSIPFYLTSPLIRKFLEKEDLVPEQMVLVIQKEVAQKICSKPPRMSLLSVSVQVYSEASILFYIPKSSFWPEPEVDAAVIRISPRKEKLVSGLFQDSFFKIVKAGFSQPRKQLLNNFSKMLKLDKENTAEWLLKNNISPKQRAETLSVSDWLKLTKTLKG
jgi:16S rRNA (adenine1518-N6/adenine1519-N6)-dimethyltransferase